MLKEDIISYGKPKSVSAEAYRALRTNLEFSMSGEGAKTILITSSHVSEGKSSVASNLAAVFAMQNKKTVLVDCDMRRGIQYKKFDIQNNNGLSNYLANINVKEKEFIKITEIPNLYIITSGPVPPNPAELLSSSRMKEMLDGLKEEYDVVVLDGAPVLPVTDSVILSSIVDRTVIVVSSGETHNEELKSVKTALDNAGANIAGVVLNKAEIRGKGYSKYGKYGKGYYGSYYGEEKNNKKKS
ncbi:MAG: CpsD/CapB family tyrosine-protein kinase [Clostridia bacterium]|nr:CpsD/CapB family tyrosine-protein kinase [Clostridia bacterium]